MKTRFLFFLVLGFFLLSTTTISAQVYKLRSTGMAFKLKTDEVWDEWSDFSDVSVLITLDIDKSRFQVFSKEKQTFDVIENEGQETDEDGDDFYSFYCLDAEGKNCRIRFAILHSQEDRMQLYVDYNDMKYVYNCDLLED